MENEIYIGDNLNFLKSNIMKKYESNIQCIYIDPPYNTKTNKSYIDRRDSDSWQLFMKERLEISKKFLKDEGVIFISIDDNEYANLKILCDEIFGSRNYLGTLITNQATRSNANYINIMHEYILCYCKNRQKARKFSIKRRDVPEYKELFDFLNKEAEELLHNNELNEANKKFKKIIYKECDKRNIKWLKNYSNIDEDGKIYFAMDLSTPGEPEALDIPSIGLSLKPLKTRRWSSEAKFIKLYNEDRLVFKNGRPYEKKYLIESEDNVQSIQHFFSRQGTNDLKKLDMDGIFDTPKPVELIKFLIRISTEKDDIVMDFFAGSGTTAQAVYELNLHGRNNSFVLIQKEEKIREKTKSYKKCLEYGIEPVISEVLFYRIDQFIKKNNINKGYRSIYGEENVKESKFRIIINI